MEAVLAEILKWGPPGVIAGVFVGLYLQERKERKETQAELRASEKETLQLMGTAMETLRKTADVVDKIREFQISSKGGAS